MKAAFNIITDREESEPLHLIIEAGSYGVSLVWFTKDPGSIKGLTVYNFPDHVLPDQFAIELEKILTNPTFKTPKASVTICYNFKSSIIIPAFYYKTNSAKEMLALVYGSRTGEFIKTDLVNGCDCFNIYSTDQKINQVLLSHFPEAKIYHSASLEIEQMKEKEKRIHAIIFHNCINVFLRNEEGFLFSGQFTYQKPADAAYHFLNCCSSYNLQPSEVHLHLSGMVDLESNLYNELYKYFLNISLRQANPGILSPDTMNIYPSHFFSHLTSLVTCVS